MKPVRKGYSASGNWAISAPRIDGCAVGFKASGTASFDVVGGPAYFVNVTTPVQLDRGGFLDFHGNSVSISGATNELLVDGTNYTYSFLNSLSPGVIVGPYGSKVLK